MKTDPESSQNLRTIGDAYRKAIEELGHPPAHFKDLEPFLKERGDPEKLRRSSEDEEEYVILYGVDPFGSRAEVLAYEKKGKDGKRYVLRGHVLFFLSDEEFRKLPFPPGHVLPP